LAFTLNTDVPASWSGMTSCRKWWCCSARNDRMRVYVPADEQSERRLHQLAGGAE